MRTGIIHIRHYKSNLVGAPVPHCRNGKSEEDTGPRQVWVLGRAYQVEGVVWRFAARRVAVVELGVCHVVDRRVWVGGRVLVQDTLVAANLHETCSHAAPLYTGYQ